MATHRQLMVGRTVLLSALLLVTACNRHDPDRAAQASRQIQANIEHGSLDQALTLATRSARQWADRDKSETYLRFKLLEAEALLHKGGEAKLASTNLQKLRIPPATPRLELQRQILLGQCFLGLNQLEDADRTLRFACDHATARHWDEPLFRTLVLQGQLCWKRQRMDSAETAFRSALELADRASDPSERMTALLDLGFLRMTALRYDDAVPYFEKALAQQSSSESQKLSVTLVNLAICQYKLGNFEAALNEIKQAISIQQKMNAQTNLVNSYDELANVYFLQDQVPRAVPYYEQALQLAVKLRSDFLIELLSRNLAAAHIELGEWEQAGKLNQQARAIAERMNDRHSAPYLQLNAAAIAAGQGDRSAAFRQYNDLVDAQSKMPPSITWEAHAGLANLYSKSGDQEQASRHFESALQAIEQTRSELSRNESKITFLSRLIHFYQDYVDLLIDRGDQRKALEVADSSRARLLAERLNSGKAASPAAPGMDLQAVARSSNSILVSYWIAPRRSVVWIVTPGGIAMQPLPESAATIQSLVDRYAIELEHDMRDTAKAGSATGTRLYSALVEPIRPYLSPGKKVIIVPDGALHNLNFETLPVPGATARYWIEEVTLSVAPSLALLAEKASKQTAGRGVLLVGNPEPNGQYPALPHAGQEIEAIRKHFPSTSFFVGADATPALYRGNHPEQFALIHFTAHAEANRESPLDSAVILSKRNDEYKLYGRDVMGTGLRARLVTVSACQSAGTKAYSGEGLVGFAWAFLHAGASNVIAGLWDVDDSSTAKLMDRMYSGLAQGDAPDRALRDAKLSLIHGASPNYRKPYYWAPLQVFRRTAQ